MFWRKNMQGVKWQKCIFILTMLLGIGCAPVQDVHILDERIYQHHLQLNKIQKEVDSLKGSTNAIQKETQDHITTFKKEATLLRENLTKETKRVQSQLDSIQKENETLRKELAKLLEGNRNYISSLQKEGTLLRENLEIETKRLQLQLDSIQKDKDSLREEVVNLQKETSNQISALKKENTLLKDDFTTENKKLQADLRIQFEALRSEIRNIVTEIGEYKELIKYLKNDVDKSLNEMNRFKEAIHSDIKILEEKDKTQSDQFKILDNRVKEIENYIVKVGEFFKSTEEYFKGTESRIKGLDDKIKQLALEQKEFEKSVLLKGFSAEARYPPTLAGELYKDAYETFQKEDLEGARKKFEAFLKQYPDTELSDNAQFWIGESYYMKKDFEKAILEYEKVITRYPEGDKVPSALLKQALSFLEIGDKNNAKNIFKRVIERYPKSEQAELAKKKLETIK